MKALGLLKFLGFFLKLSVLGAPMWVCISLLALVVLVTAYAYRRVKKRSEAQSIGELTD
jgi:membrane protein implicated in regulation of membrane protease activity